ncbi:hypothetical protein [Planomonospora venezuelensis]|uniref:Uncharacterized protein n=1 Tax=Planomonospora venezuelensis TaxID=1999 RepID=A0A841D7F9_PLAVE|nr:hypothetical protein [Planomonospora venezuelensis]MBB5963366.1 hypothetical protein [Planomonospora venezuelensis]
MALGALVLALIGCTAPSPGISSSGDERPSAETARSSPGKTRVPSPPDAPATVPPQPVAAPTLLLRSAKPFRLEPVRARPTACLQPPARADDFRVAGKAPAWKGLAADKDDAFAAPLGVAAAADGTVWAVHDRDGAGYRPGRLRRWDGSAWRVFDIPAVPFSGPFDSYSNPHTAKQVAVTPDRQVRVFGSPQYAHRSSGPAMFVHTFDEGRWRSEVFPVAAEPDASVQARGPWVRYGVGRALHWTGSAWRSYRLPAPQLGVPGYGGLQDVSMFEGRGDEFWAIAGREGDGGGWRTGLLRWEGTGWREIGMPGVGGPGRGVLKSGRRLIETYVMVNDVAVLGAGDVWVVGAAVMLVETGEDEEVDFRPMAMHWDGRSWSCHWGPAAGDRSEWFQHAEPDGAGGMWVVSKAGKLWHMSGGRWSRGRLPGFGGCAGPSVDLVMDLVVRPGGRQVYALGTHRCGRVVRSALWRTG